MDPQRRNSRLLTSVLIRMKQYFPELFSLWSLIPGQLLCSLGIKRSYRSFWYYMAALDAFISLDHTTLEQLVIIKLIGQISWGHKSPKGHINRIRIRTSGLLTWTANALDGIRTTALFFSLPRFISPCKMIGIFAYQYKVLLKIVFYEIWVAADATNRPGTWG